MKDPAVAEKLIPKNHGFGTRRVPLETKYYEVYNQDNVKLVDITETPIERITPTGIKTSDAEYEFDIIIYATGFDAITGSFDRIDIRGADGQRLKDRWKGGPRDLSRRHGRRLPQHDDADGTAYGAGQYSAQHRIQRRLGDRSAALRARPRPDAPGGHGSRRGILDRSRQVAGRRAAVQRGQLLDDRHQPQRRGQADPHHRRYSGSAPAYRARCDEVAANGYRELALS